MVPISVRYCIPSKRTALPIIAYASRRADFTLSPVARMLRTRPPPVTSSPDWFLAVPAWNILTLWAEYGWIIILSPKDCDVGYPLEARTTTTLADELVWGARGLLASLVILECWGQPLDIS